MRIDDIEIAISGRWLRKARFRNEYYDYAPDPAAFLAKLSTTEIGADLFTFLAEIPDRSTEHPYYHEPDPVAVIPLTTFEHWWKHQISDKTRNMARKAAKKGVEIKVVAFDDALVHGIMAINDESPVRQGRPYWHYRKDFSTVKREHITYVEQTDFISAFLGTELIGYIKLVHGRGKSSIMQILSKMAHRDKAPNNALIAKAVEICTAKNVPHLHYATWSRRGLGDFKISHGFQRFEVPRFFVPLTAKGAFMLRLKLHHRLRDRLPEKWLDLFSLMRAKWYDFRHKGHTGRPASPETIPSR